MFPDAPDASQLQVNDVFPRRSLSWLIWEKVPLLFLCAVDAALTVYTQKGVRLQYLPPLGWRLTNFIVSYVLYIFRCFWPSGMAPEQAQLGRFLTAWQISGALILLLAVTGLVIVYRRYRYLPVGWFWFLGMLVPMNGLLQPEQKGMADRFAYQAYLGLFIMVCWGVSDWAERKKISVGWLASAGAVVLMALTVVTYQQIGYWRDAFTLWGRAAQVSKFNWRAQDNFAVQLTQRGRKDEALLHFHRAAEINPRDGASNFMIALEEEQHGLLRDALRHYEHALQDSSVNLKDDDRARIWTNMAVVYRRLGDDLNAVQCLERAGELQNQPKQ